MLTFCILATEWLVFDCLFLMTLAAAPTIISHSFFYLNQPLFHKCANAFWTLTWLAPSRFMAMTFPLGVISDLPDQI